MFSNNLGRRNLEKDVERLLVEAVAAPSLSSVEYVYRLSANTAVSATSIILNRAVPGPGANEFYVVIDPFTTDCEIRKVTAVSGATCTVGALDYAHAADDVVLWTVDPTVNVKWFGATGDGTTDDTTAITRAIAQAVESNNDHRLVYMPGGEYKVTSTIAIAAYGLQIRGAHDRRPVSVANETGATRINYTGTGELFEIGTDPSPDPYDNADYDGYHSFEMKNISMKYTGGTTTALGNGASSYGTGTYAIRDWKGGSIRLENVWIENFAFGFWGIQSDQNRFTDVWVRYCNVGIELGPRSDQFTGVHISTLYNDTDLILDRCENASFYSCKFIQGGSATEYPIDIGSSYSSRGTEGAVFVSCWFEHLGSSYSVIDSFIRIGYFGGSDDTIQTQGVVFYNPHVLTNASPSTPRAKYFMTVGNGTHIRVDQMTGRPDNLDDLFEYLGATDPQIWLHGPDDSHANLDMVKTGSGTPEFNKFLYGAGFNKVASRLGWLYNFREPPDTGKDHRLGSDADDTFVVDFLNSSNETKRILISRRLRHGAAAPTTGTWAQGDMVLNTAPADGGTVGWVCVTAGSPGTWMQFGNTFEDWTDYSATSTITGWTSFTTKQLSYLRNGDLVFVQYQLQGTSNSTSTSFTLPYSQQSSIALHQIVRGMDSGGWLDYCLMTLTASASTVNFYTSKNAAAWTGSGDKRIIGEFMYKIA